MTTPKNAKSTKHNAPRSEVMEVVADLARANTIADAATRANEVDDMICCMESGARSYVRRGVLSHAPECMADAVAQLAAIYSVVDQTIDLLVPSSPSEEGKEYLLAVLRRLLYFVAAESGVDLKKTRLDELAGYIDTIDNVDWDAKRLASEKLLAPADYWHGQ